MTPLFVILLLKSLFGFALLVFVIAGISDALDGLIARYFDQRTALGAYLDPVADKFLLTAAFISLAVLKIIPGWVTVIVISRDVLILLGIAVFSLTNIPVTIKPSIISKFTTVAQLAAVALTLLELHIQGLGPLLQTLFWVTVGLTTISGLHYIFIGMNLLQSGSGNHNGSKQ